MRFYLTYYIINNKDLNEPWLIKGSRKGNNALVISQDPADENSISIPSPIFLRRLPLNSLSNVKKISSWAFSILIAVSSLLVIILVKPTISVNITAASFRVGLSDEGIN